MGLWLTVVSVFMPGCPEKTVSNGRLPLFMILKKDGRRKASAQIFPDSSLTHRWLSTVVLALLASPRPLALLSGAPLHHEVLSIWISLPIIV